MNDDHYSVLEIDPDATTAQIRTAYRRLARRLHPDRAGPAAGPRFRLVTEAYRVLSDPAARAAYDRAAGRAQRPSDPAPSPFQEWGRRRQRRGRDLMAILDLDLESAVRGGVGQVVVEGPVECGGCAGEGFDPRGPRVACWTCGGSGTASYANRLGETTAVCLTCAGEGEAPTRDCPMCEGHGTVTGVRTVTVPFPAGVDDGATLLVAGAGGPPGAMGQSGDLHVTVQVRTHPLFRRVGSDLAVTVPVHYAEAALGADLRVPGIDGPLDLHLPAGTDGGSVLRVPGAGVRAEGDLLVTIRIVVPVPDDDVDREAIRSLLPSDPHAVRSHLFDL